MWFHLFLTRGTGALLTHDHATIAPMQSEIMRHIVKNNKHKLSASELKNIANRLQSGPYKDYPAAKDRLFLRHVKVLSDRRLWVPSGPWQVNHHPNRTQAHDGRQSVHVQKTTLPRKDAWVDQYGRLLHPYWRQLLSDPQIGLPTGYGFFYRYGPNITVDAAVYRFAKKDQPPEFLLIKRRDTGLWALPGGFVDATDATLKAAARREIQEETGLNNVQAAAEIIWRESRVGLRTTLHAWTENILLLFHGSSQYLINAKLVAGDDAIEASWFTVAVAQQRLTLLDRHTRYLAKAAAILAQNK